MKVSVILPTFEGSIPTILPALKSISSQSLKEFECLIVDDSNDKNIVDFLNEYCIKDNRFIYIRGDGKGLASALNKGITFAKGEFIARSDSTDISQYDRLYRQVKFLQKNKDIDILGANMIMKSNGNNRISNYPESHFGITFQFIYRCPIAHPTVMFRRSIIEEGLRYSESFKYCEDLEFWLRLWRKNYRFANLKENLVEYDASASARSTIHNIYNIGARIFNCTNPLIFLSIFARLIHLFLPRGLRSLVENLFISKPESKQKSFKKF